MNRTPLPVPAFFDAANAGRWEYNPNAMDVFAAAATARAQHAVKAAGSDKTNVHLLLIDLQLDFCHPQGTLYVGGRSGRGAIDDNVRIAEFIYRNADLVTGITTTMDTHFAFQIFTPAFWETANGGPVAAFTEISADAVAAGAFRPTKAMAAWLCNGNYLWLCRQVEYYCRELEKTGKYKLMVWPPHCLLGSQGHALAGVIHEARLYHSFLRGSQSLVEIKGGHPLSENYSVLSPEVRGRHDAKPELQKNVAFVKTLLASDVVIIAGQAASHCVASSIDDLLGEITATDPALARKVYILKDGMSAVTVPDGKGGFFADYTPQAEAALKKFEAAGMHVVSSTDPIESWPNVRL